MTWAIRILTGKHAGNWAQELSPGAFNHAPSPEKVTLFNSVVDANVAIQRRNIAMRDFESRYLVVSVTRVNGVLVEGVEDLTDLIEHGIVES